MSQEQYVNSLADTGHLPSRPSAVIADLIDNLDSLSGSPINVGDRDVWLSTHEQVAGFLRDFQDAYALLEVTRPGAADLVHGHKQNETCGQCLV